MNEYHLVIAITVISVLLMITLIFFIAREIISKNTKGIGFPEPELQRAGDELANTSTSEAETKKEHELESSTKAPLYSSEDDIEIIEESQTNETVSLTQTLNYENLPQDSMLRRHTITQLCALVESNMPLRPTDSVLRRHYDTMINNEINKRLGSKVV
jgi:hypothetical protein